MAVMLSLIKAPACTQTSGGTVNLGALLSTSFTSICISRTVSEIFTPFRHSSIMKAQLYKPNSCGESQSKSPVSGFIVKLEGKAETSLGCLKLGAVIPRLAGLHVSESPVRETDKRYAKLSPSASTAFGL